MRFLLSVLLLSSFAIAQDAPPPAPEDGKPTEETGPVAPDDKLGPDTPVREPEPAADAWRVTQPVSNPQGDAITLKVARDTNKKRTVTLLLERGEKMKLGITGVVSIRDGASFSWPLQLTKFVQQGMDMTAMAAPQFQNASLAGKLTADGRVDTSSVAVNGLGPMGAQFVGFAYWAFPIGGQRDARVGESWALDVTAYAKRIVLPAPAEETLGSVFQVFEAVEDKDGVSCARVRSTYGIKMTKVATPMGSTDILVTGSTTDWIDMDGQLRARTVDDTITAPTGTTKMKVTMTATVSEAAPTAPGCGCGAAEGCGCGDGCDSGDPCGCGGGDDAAGGACGCGE
ncbi:MAG: hypothetical protein V3T86_14670 [Planctomycetota bacterium]